jgi:hypothetical protein
MTPCLRLLVESSRRFLSIIVMSGHGECMMALSVKSEFHVFIIWCLKALKHRERTKRAKRLVRPILDVLVLHNVMLFLLHLGFCQYNMFIERVHIQPASHQPVFVVLVHLCSLFHALSKVNMWVHFVKATPVTGREAPQVYESSRLPHLTENRSIDGGEIVGLTRRPPFTSKENSLYSFLLEAESTPGT